MGYFISARPKSSKVGPDWQILLTAHESTATCGPFAQVPPPQKQAGAAPYTRTARQGGSCPILKKKNLVHARTARRSAFQSSWPVWPACVAVCQTARSQRCRSSQPAYHHCSTIPPRSTVPSMNVVPGPGHSSQQRPENFCKLFTRPPLSGRGRESLASHASGTTHTTTTKSRLLLESPELRRAGGVR